mmetsp:Transcript_40408/g.97537  ORF Transcript_40408/g.97537 Transcript_40408/m.97537 type:complete len:404 (-) Transcript_40408:60-1271(-)
MFENMLKKFEEKSGMDGMIANSGTTQQQMHSTTGNSSIPFAYYEHSGGSWPVPEDYHFPNGTVQDLWTRWNVADTVNGIPPLRTLQGKSFTFMASRAKARSPARIFCDIKALCEYIENTCVADQVVLDCETPEKACAVLYSVATQENGIINTTSNRSKHCKWSTALTRIQQLKRKRRRQGGAQRNRERETTSRRENVAATTVEVAATTVDAQRRESLTVDTQRRESLEGQSRDHSQASTSNSDDPQSGGRSRGSSRRSSSSVEAAGVRPVRQSRGQAQSRSRNQATTSTREQAQSRSRSQATSTGNSGGGRRNQARSDGRPSRRPKRRRTNNDPSHGDDFASAFGDIAVPPAARAREVTHDKANERVVLEGVLAEAGVSTRTRNSRQTVQPMPDGTYLHLGNT